MTLPRCHVCNAHVDPFDITPESKVDGKVFCSATCRWKYLSEKHRQARWHW